MHYYWSLRRIRQHLSRKYTDKKNLTGLPATIIISKSEAGRVLETQTPHELQDFIERMEYSGFPVKDNGEQIVFDSSFIEN